MNAKTPTTKRATTKATKRKATTAKSAPKLLSGGNPQIAKGDGADVVAQYIAALPDWKRDVGAALDAAIVDAVPGAAKAVRWNTPFYGLEGRGWFIAFHAMSKYIKVTFFRGTSLDPMPPESSKVAEVRYVHLAEGAVVDAQLRAWIKQAAALPGEMVF